MKILYIKPYICSDAPQVRSGCQHLSKVLNQFLLGVKKFFLGYSLVTTKPLVYVGCVVELEV